MRSKFQGSLYKMCGVFLGIGVWVGEGGDISFVSIVGTTGIEGITSGLSLVLCVPVSTWVPILMLRICYYRVRQKENPNLGRNSFGWEAHTVVRNTSSNSGIHAVFNVYYDVVGRTSSLYC